MLNKFFQTVRPRLAAFNIGNERPRTADHRLQSSRQYYLSLYQIHRVAGKYTAGGFYHWYRWGFSFIPGAWQPNERQVCRQPTDPYQKVLRRRSLLSLPNALYQPGGKQEPEKDCARYCGYARFTDHGG